MVGNGSCELHLLIHFLDFSAGLGVLNMAVQAVKRMAGADANPQFFLLDKDVWCYTLLCASYCS